jgi:hypothetical protein
MTNVPMERDQMEEALYSKIKISNRLATVMFVDA